MNQASFCIFDFETAPPPKFEDVSHLAPDALTATECPPSIKFAKMPDFSLQYKKPETIASHSEKWQLEQNDKIRRWGSEQEEKQENFRLGGMLDPTVGYLHTFLTCVPTETGIKVEIVSGPEKDLIALFGLAYNNHDKLIGHNIEGFDIPYVLLRAIINGITLPEDIRRGRYFSDKFKDTMKAWGDWGYRGMEVKQGLDYISKVLGFPLKPGDPTQFHKWDQPTQINYAFHDAVTTTRLAVRLGIILPLNKDDAHETTVHIEYNGQPVVPSDALIEVAAMHKLTYKLTTDSDQENIPGL